MSITHLFEHESNRTVHFYWQTKHIRNEQTQLKQVDIKILRSEINVTHIVSVDEFYGIQPLYADKISALKKKLNHDFAYGGKGEIVPVPLVGICYITHFDNAWFRAKILANNGHGQFHVCLIDVAKLATVSWNNLFYMDDKYQSVPDCCLQMALHDLTSYHTTKKALTDKFLELYQHSKAHVVKFEPCVKKQCHSVTLHAITNDCRRICINNELNNPSGMKPLSSSGQSRLIVPKTKPLSSSAQNRLSVPKAIATQTGKNDECQKYDVIMVHYKSPSDFYVALVDDINRLRSIETGIAQYCEQPTHHYKGHTMDWNVRDPCYVKYNEKWHRGVVIKKSANVCLVYLVDYGNMIRVEVPEDLILPKDENVAPGIAIKCHLAFLQASSQNRWSKTSIEQFGDYCRESKKLAISVPHLRSNTASVAVVLWGYGPMDIQAFKVAKPKVNNINADMVFAGLARSTTVDFDEFFFHDDMPISNAIDNKRLLDGLINDNNDSSIHLSSSTGEHSSESSTFMWLPAAPIVRTTFTATPQHIDKHMHIYAQTKEQAACCDVITQTLNGWHQNQAVIPKITNWKKGEACIAKFLDGCYHRAQILSVDAKQNKCKVNSTPT